MSRVGAPRLRPRRPFVCVGRVVCVGVACGCFGSLGQILCAAFGLAWGCFGAGLGVLWAGFGVAGACVVIPCLRSYACWPGLGSVGGITTIGAALRRVAGVSGVYGRKAPRVVARKGKRRVLFRWLCWLCSACLRLFVGVVWLVFVGGLGGIATIGAALRRVVGVSGVYGRKTPRVLGRKGQRRVPVEGSMVAKPPECLLKVAVHLGEMRVTWGVWGVVDDGLGALVRGEAFLWCGVSGTSGPSACCWDDRAHCRRFLRGGAGGRRILVCFDGFLCCGRGGAAAYGQVFLRRDRLSIVCSCARVLVCSLGPSTALSERESRSSLSQPPKVFTSAPYTSGGASWQPRSCGVVVS